MNNIEEDPFESVKLGSSRTVSSNNNQTNISENSESDDPFESVRLGKSSLESTSQTILRNSARTASRIGETIGGLPGDLAKSAKSDTVLKYLSELSGFKNPIPEKEDSQLFPTSEEIQKYTEEKSGGYLSPKNEAEKIGDEFTKTFAQFIGPNKFGMGPLKALGAAIFGTGTKEGLKALGFDKPTQEYGKLASIVLSSMLNPKGVKNLWEKNYNIAEKLAPPGTFVSGKPLEFKLDRIIATAEKGVGTPAEMEVIKVANNLKKKIKNGKVDVNEMMASKRSLNKLTGDPAFFEGAEHLFNDVRSALDGSIKLHKNPNFIKAYQQGNEAYGGFMESKKVSKYISSILKKTPLSLKSSALIFEMFFPELIAPTLAGAAAGKTLLTGSEIATRFFKNKTLQQYYVDVLKNAAKQNAKGVMQNILKLDEELEKEKNQPHSPGRE